MGFVAGYMVPHPPIAVREIGRGEERKIQATLDAFREVAQDIVAQGSFRRFGAGSVRFSVRYDTELVRAIEEEADREDFPAGTMGERDPELDHGTMVPLYFINQEYTDYQLVRIGLSGLREYDPARGGPPGKKMRLHRQR